MTLGDLLLWATQQATNPLKQGAGEAGKVLTQAAPYFPGAMQTGGGALNVPAVLGTQIPGMPQQANAQGQQLHAPVPNPIAGVQALQGPHAGMQQTPQQGMAANKTAAQGKGYTDYTVKPGDTLWGIAQQHTGNGDLWHQIKIPGNNYHNDPRFLQPGTTVHIPSAAMQKPGVGVGPAPSNVSSSRMIG